MKEWRNEVSYRHLHIRVVGKNVIAFQHAFRHSNQMLPNVCRHCLYIGSKLLIRIREVREMREVPCSWVWWIEVWHARLFEYGLLLRSSLEDSVSPPPISHSDPDPISAAETETGTSVLKDTVGTYNFKHSIIQIFEDSNIRWRIHKWSHSPDPDFLLCLVPLPFPITIQNLRSFLRFFLSFSIKQ